MSRIKSPLLIVSQPKDLVFPDEMIQRTVAEAKKAGRDVSHVTIQGARGHLDGVISMKQAEGAVKAFLEK